MDNTAWTILVALGSVGSGIVSSLSTTATMRRGNRDERRKEIDERVDAKITAHASSCRLSDHLADVIEKNQDAVANDLEHERRERSAGREANHASIERMRVEIITGQREILDRVISIQSVQTAQGVRLDAHEREITRLRDGKVGGGR